MKSFNKWTGKVNNFNFKVKDAEVIMSGNPVKNSA